MLTRIDQPIEDPHSISLATRRDPSRRLDLIREAAEEEGQVGLAAGWQRANK